jgi:hypothetical protein
MRPDPFETKEIIPCITMVRRVDRIFGQDWSFHLANVGPLYVFEKTGAQINANISKP